MSKILPNFGLPRRVRGQALAELDEAGLMELTPDPEQLPMSARLREVMDFKDEQIADARNQCALACRERDEAIEARDRRRSTVAALDGELTEAVRLLEHVGLVLSNTHDLDPQLLSAYSQVRGFLSTVASAIPDDPAIPPALDPLTGPVALAASSPLFDQVTATVLPAVAEGWPARV